jgi:hypothetical protein
MSNGTVAPPLDIDLNTIDTSMPLIADNSLADFTIAKVELRKTKAGGDMLGIDATTTGPTKSQDGHDLGSGIHVFTNLNLAPSGKSDWTIVARNIASLTQAAGVQFDGGGLAQQIEQLRTDHVALLTGKQFRAKVGITPAGVDKNGRAYRAKNEFTVFLKP